MIKKDMRKSARNFLIMRCLRCACVPDISAKFPPKLMESLNRLKSYVMGLSQIKSKETVQKLKFLDSPVL